MPEFAPNEVKTARAPITVQPPGLSCTAELYLVSDAMVAATSGVKSFASTGAKQDISFPISMPGVEGTYPVWLDVYAEGSLIGAYVATEDVVIAPIADAWVYPSGYSDPDGKWINEANAYDGNLETYAFNSLTKYGHYVEYLLGVPLNCSKVRIYALAYIPYEADNLRNPNLAIDVYYENSWHKIFSGGISRQTWVEKSIPAGTKIVSKARIKSNRSDAHLEIREFQFWGH